MSLSSALRTLRDDVRAIFRNDPAARNLAEVLLYPGLHAILFHRLAHALWKRRIPFLPRFISQLARFWTGIEIHPGARIGHGFFIDHGMGVVIGETTEIGHNVMLYQGVTLGGTGKQQGKRHPTLEDGVVVGVGASVLGAITIGRGARVGGGAVVVKDVPPYATAVGVPGRIVATRDPATGVTRRIEELPDPEGEMLRGLRAKVLELETRLSDLEDATHTHHAEHHLSYDALPASLWRILDENIVDEEYNLGAGI
ncbi:serine O-acetyltransferase [Oscillochloris trichoides DG-6]|uniref:Serine acetyltransferase n=1 Tax=Oscillochloris trichoides DG-6 TaxID=765420 RepID=E1ICB6_9CHLR|nr:serine O-acetyltransferase EpsC [Oscillochloris trichoides]EFO81170.1 serine O-acetyltransferase [Oscillochloris trichoides DG-6]